MKVFSVKSILTLILQTIHLIAQNILLKSISNEDSFFQSIPGIDSSRELINTDFVEAITMRRHWFQKGMGRFGASVFNVGKKLKLLLGAKGSTLLEISKKAIRYFLSIQKQKFLTSLAVENGFLSTTMAAMTLTVLQLSLSKIPLWPPP